MFIETKKHAMILDKRNRLWMLKLRGKYRPPKVFIERVMIDGSRL